MHKLSKFLKISCAALACGATGLTMSEVTAAEALAIRVSLTSPVQPILIRNDHKPLLRITLEVTDPTDVVVTEIAFQLDGTDDIRDVGSLRGFWTGDSETFSSETSFGDSAGASSTVTFRGQQKLAIGKNVFWLTCQLSEAANLVHHVFSTHLLM